MRHLVANLTQTRVHLTVRPDDEDDGRRIYIFSLEETPPPDDAVASVWIEPGRYVGIPMDTPRMRFRGENPADAVLREGTMDGKNAWFIEGFKN